MEESDEELVLRLLKRCAGIADPLPITFSNNPQDLHRMQREMEMMQRLIQDGLAEGFIHEKPTPTNGRPAGRSVGLLGILPKGMAVLAPCIPDFEKEIATLSDTQLEAELKKSVKNLRYHTARRELDARIAERTRQEEMEIEKQVLLEVQQRQEALARERRSTSFLRNKRFWGVASGVVGGLSILMWAVPIMQKIWPSSTEPAPVIDPSLFRQTPKPLSATPPPSYFYSKPSEFTAPSPPASPKPAASSRIE